jgi:hypothetical protein
MKDAEFWHDAALGASREKSDGRGGALADIYSVGVIVTEFLTAEGHSLLAHGRTLEDDREVSDWGRGLLTRGAVEADPANGFALDESLTELWKSLPTLAAILEDATSHTPEERLWLGGIHPLRGSEFDGANRSGVFSRFRSEVVEEITALRQRNHPGTAAHKPVRAFWDLTFGMYSTSRLAEVWGTRRAARGGMKELAWLAVAVAVMWWTIVARWDASHVAPR